jgi:hypothetical protein
MIVATLSIFHAWFWMGVGMGKFLNGLGMSNTLDTKLHGLGGWQFCCHTVVDRML